MKIVFISLVIFCILYVTPISNFVLETKQNPTITVYVQGEVEEQKKIVLERYSTIEDVLEQVEFTKDADISLLNPLLVVKDKDVIVVPKKTEGIRISINYASLDELMRIPGIGEAKAWSIIEYRNTVGLFQSLEELMKIPGIKEKTFLKLKDYICL